jgi:tetratricopeptide (TPR) repeat protein
VKTLLLLLIGIRLYAARIEPEPGSSTEWAKRGNILFSSSRYREAEVVFKKALDLANYGEAPNPDQQAVLNINLAAAYRLQARYREAEPLYRKALDYAESDPSASSHMRGALRGLALLALEQGRLAEAETLARRSLALEKKGTDPTVLAEGANMLAAILLARGEFRDSELSANQALSSFPKEDWRFHQASGIALNTLGRVSLAQGKNDLAEAYFSQAGQILETLLGRENQTVAAVSANLAEARARRGDWKSATALLTTSIATLEIVLGKNHPEVASGLSTLATIYKGQKQHRKAKPLFERALRIDEYVLGPQALKTGVDLNNLGSIAFDQHRFQHAIALFSRALAIDQRILGANHPDTGLVAGNLAEAYFFRKQYSEAEPLFRLAIAVGERTRGPEDLNLATLLSKYSKTLRASGRFSEAEFAEVRSVRIRVRNAIRSSS